MTNDPRLIARIDAHPYPLLFATISGAHLYGFASADSDFDLRGVHILPADDLLGLTVPRETIESEGIFDGLEIDFVTHDVRKLFGLMLKKNGYVLEQLHSPLIVQTSPEHAELVAIGRRCVTRHHAHHYLGFAETQWRLFEKEMPRRVKPLLYVYRVLLTGIHLMRSGEVQADLTRLNESFQLPQIADLIAMKVAGAEKETLAPGGEAFHAAEYVRLRSLLEAEYECSALSETTVAKPALHDLLLRLRRKGLV